MEINHTTSIAGQKSEGGANLPARVPIVISAPALHVRSALAHQHQVVFVLGKGGGSGTDTLTAWLIYSIRQAGGTPAMLDLSAAPGTALKAYSKEPKCHTEHVSFLDWAVASRKIVNLTQSTGHTVTLVNVPHSAKSDVVGLISAELKLVVPAAGLKVFYILGENEPSGEFAQKFFAVGGFGQLIECRRERLQAGRLMQPTVSQQGAFIIPQLPDGFAATFDHGKTFETAFAEGDIFTKARFSAQHLRFLNELGKLV